MNSNKEILKSEFDSLVDDIRLAYETSGKMVSGQFGEGLEIRQPNNNLIQLWGFTYLAGRKKGQMPPVESIKQWIEQRGIRPIEEFMTTTSLAWAIAKSIAKKGTNKENHLKIYEEVITPQRIQQILDKVSNININLFVENITTEFTKLENI